MQLWLKAFHLVFMVAWFAGTFYMFRLFVYHAENRDKPEITTLLKVMEAKLYRQITTPAMVATWVFGLSMLALNPQYLRAPWLIAKLVLVLGLSGYHGYIGRTRRRFAADDVFLTPRQCRIRNEIPTFFLLAIVLLAVLRPGG
jgi:putative membrane protein